MTNTNQEVHDEIERKFLPAHIPEEIIQGIKDESFRMISILQGYIQDERGTRLRHELENDEHRYFETWKEGEGLKRPEHERRIDGKEFLNGWGKIDCKLRKFRYLIPYGKYTIELNIFLGPLAGYIQLEVEFDSEEEALAFIPPEWFGREVTYDKQHGNFSLAKNGILKEELC